MMARQTIIPSNLLRKVSNLELPLSALAAIREIRDRLEELERVLIQQARKKGASWGDVADAIGISRQALHLRLKNPPTD